MSRSREPPLQDLTKQVSWSKQPLSTISYNTEHFLKNTLQVLIDEKIILDYMYIKHKGELGTKDHTHLLIVPTRSVDINRLRETFEEPDANNEIPLGVMPFQTTHEQNFKDWLLYVLHNDDYLKQKGLQRLYHYKKEDIQSNNQEWVNRLYAELEQRISEIEVMLSYIEQNFEWYQAAKKLKIGTNYLSHFKDTYKMLQSEFAGFEEFAIDMVNGVIEEKSYKRSIKGTLERERSEYDELRQELQRANDIIDILMKNADSKQVNFVLDELRKQQR